MAQAKLEGEQAVRVKRQVEFYFSDSNAPRDKFLMEQIRADREGYVWLSTICKFSRMQALLFPGPFNAKRVIPDALSRQVGETLKECESLEVSENSLQVRRVTEINAEAAVQAVDERSLYATPFPYDATIEQLSKFWGSIAALNGVRLRRHATSRDFKGSVFVEFTTQELMREVLQKQLEYADAPLRMEPKLDYIARKKEDRKDELLVEVSPDYVPPPEPEEAAANGAASSPEPEPEDEPHKRVPGCVISIYLPPEPRLQFHAVKDSLGGWDKGVKFCDIRMEEDGQYAYVRFYTPQNAADALATAVDSKITVGGSVGEPKLLTGENEERYYEQMDKVCAERSKKQGVSAGGRGRGKKRPFDRGGRRGRGRGRARH